ncbi:MAG: PEP-CTERM sorting domain-containing protein [Roseibacillus sp.]
MKTLLPIFLLLPSLAVAQSDIDSFSAATNDRFANDPSFIGSAFDFSGIGRTTQNNGRWATLIADNVYITANHFRASGAVTFYEQDNTTSHVRSFAGGMRIGSTDFYLGYFATPLPTTIARYDFTTIPINTPEFPVPLPGPEFAYTVGLTPSTGGYANNDLTNMAVGENRVEYYQADSDLTNGAGTVIATTDSVYTIQNEPTDPGFTYETHESAANGGDSGSPLLVVDGGELVLWGVAGGEGSINLAGGTRDLSVYSYTGNYATEIQDFIDINLVPIPEPSTILLLGLSGLSFLTRRRS